MSPSRATSRGASRPPLRAFAGPEAACRRLRADAFALADGELSSAAAANLWAHTAACGGCREALAGDAAFVGWLRRSTPRPVAPPALRDRLRRLLAERGATAVTSPSSSDAVD
jgi:hypothetical protein